MTQTLDMLLKKFNDFKHSVEEEEYKEEFSPRAFAMVRLEDKLNDVESYLYYIFGSVANENN